MFFISWDYDQPADSFFCILSLIGQPPTRRVSWASQGKAGRVRTMDPQKGCGMSSVPRPSGAAQRPLEYKCGIASFNKTDWQTNITYWMSKNWEYMIVYTNIKKMLWYVIFSYAHAHGLTFKCLPSTYPFADPFVVHLFLYMSFSIPSLQLGDAPPSSSSRVAQKISLCPPLEYVTGQDSIRLGEFRNPIHSQHPWPMTTDPHFGRQIADSMDSNQRKG